MKKYVFRKYDPVYVKFFVSENQRLKNILGENIHIQHIGSTAVPGLGGKGILDITIGVGKTKMSGAKKQLEKARYIFREQASFPERLFFRKDYVYKKRKRRVHIHLVLYKGKDFNEMVGFRDYLLQHPLIVEKYSRIKKEAVVVAHGDGEKYRNYKQTFIDGILKKIVE